jgi:hypothetical protein
VIIRALLRVIEQSTLVGPPRRKIRLVVGTRDLQGCCNALILRRGGSSVSSHRCARTPTSKPQNHQQARGRSVPHGKETLVKVDAVGDLSFLGNLNGVLYVLSHAYKRTIAFLFCVIA